MASPDDVCGVCSNTRENHGDMQHKFSVDGVLQKLDPPAPPRQQPPRHRDDPKPQDMEHGYVLRLTEVLIDKGILDARDLLRVMGGGRDAS